jgi:hypothetical protein
MLRICNPAPVVLSDFASMRREPRRPPPLREPGFDDEFDDTTLFYDAFRALNTEKVLLMAPPFFNLAAAVKSARITAAPSHRSCRFHMKALDLCARIDVDVPCGSEALLFNSDLGSFQVRIRENLSHCFRGLRTLFTLSKNNAMPWILDWIRYHRDVHGAEAVLLYDNASTAYDVHALREALAKVQGLKAACIVAWPFKYGPQGDLSRRSWDSAFCQHGAWEHARWRLLAQARSVMAVDVDELVVSKTGQTAFEAAERSLTGIVRYFGAWIVGIEGVSPPQPHNGVLRHRDYDVMVLPGKPVSRFPWSRPEFGGFPKWTVVPRRCPSWSQWKVHTIGRWPVAHPVSRSLCFRHFREISDSWKYDRSVRDRFDPAVHKHDAELQAAFARVQWEA